MSCGPHRTPGHGTTRGNQMHPSSWTAEKTPTPGGREAYDVTLRKCFFPFRTNSVCHQPRKLFKESRRGGAGYTLTIEFQGLGAPLQPLSFLAHSPLPAQEGRAAQSPGNWQAWMFLERCHEDSGDDECVAATFFCFTLNLSVNVTNITIPVFQPDMSGTILRNKFALEINK